MSDFAKVDDRLTLAASALRSRGEDEAGPLSSSALVVTRNAAHIYLRAAPGPREQDFASRVMSTYDGLLRELRARGAEPRHVVTEKLFFRDIAAQLPLARTIRREFYRDTARDVDPPPATTFIQQPPACPDQRFELQAFALLPADQGRAPGRAIEDLPPGASGRIVEAGARRHVYLANVTGGEGRDGWGLSRQAADMFRRAEACLGREGLSFRNVVRTWLYVAEIDRCYGALNRERRAFFESRGVRPAPASTGIQGVLFPRDRGCGIDLHALAGRGGIDVRPMRSPTMNEAPTYGSDFSRGMRVSFEDHSLLYVSGTASIDAEGQVIHAGDFEGQVARMLLNVGQLLAGQGAGLDDIVSAVTYLKRPDDLPAFLRVSRGRGVPESIPHTICVAEVCRPEWLCEMEAIALLA